MNLSFYQYFLCSIEIYVYKFIYKGHGLEGYLQFISTLILLRVLSNHTWFFIFTAMPKIV